MMCMCIVYIYIYTHFKNWFQIDFDFNVFLILCLICFFFHFVFSLIKFLNMFDGKCLCCPLFWLHMFLDFLCMYNVSFYYLFLLHYNKKDIECLLDGFENCVCVFDLLPFASLSSTILKIICIFNQQNEANNKERTFDVWIYFCGVLKLVIFQSLFNWNGKE